MLGLARCCLCGSIRRKKKMSIYQEPFYTQYYEEKCLLSPQKLKNEMTRNVLLQHKDVTEKLTEKNLRTVHKLRFGPTKRRKQPTEEETEPSFEEEDVPQPEKLKPKDLIKIIKDQCDREGIALKDLVSGKKELKGE